MKSYSFWKLSLFAGAFVLSACAPAAAPGSNGSTTPAEQPATQLTLRIVIRSEPASIAGTVLVPTGITTGTQRRLFSAGLALKDDKSEFRPYLAQGLPQLNSGDWTVSPDGQLEMTYHLQPNLTWQDGAPLTASDFVFAGAVYRTPEYGIGKSAPYVYMDDVSAPDARTVVIRWNQLYPDAAYLDAGTLKSFTPLPAHILQSAYEQQRENLPTNPYWTTEFVGTGPYQVAEWQPGAFIDARAFAGHVLGKPKIDRLHISWNADFNATLATLLAGDADIPGDDSIRLEQGQVLEQQWTGQNGGTVQYRPQLPRFIQVQHRAEFADPQAVRDVRVRQALAYAIDRNATNEAIFLGKAITTDSLIYPSLPYYNLVDQSTHKYTYDPRQTDQILTGAGYSKGADGVYSGPGGRLDFEVRNVQSDQNDRERSIIADGWRKAGFQIEEDVFAPSQTSDGETLGKFRSLSITSAAPAAEGLTLGDLDTASISRPDTRWLGQNRGGWSNDAYDQAATSWLTTLDLNQRHQLVAQAAKALGDDLGVIPLEFNPGVVAYSSPVHGIQLVTPDSELSWNIWEWEMR